MLKNPLAYTVVPLSVRAQTSLSALGSQGVASPVVASSAAMWFRACPPMLVKYPPAYTVVPLTAKASTDLRTAPYAFGSQEVASPVVASSAAMLFRDCPPMLVKYPPTYTVVPLTARAATRRFAFGSQEVASPVVASSAAMLFRDCPPMLVKYPPTYTVVPLTAR